MTESMQQSKTISMKLKFVKEVVKRFKQVWEQ